MNRVAIFFCTGVSAAGLVLALSGLSVAADMDKTVAPISTSTPDIVAVEPLDSQAGGSAASLQGAPVTFKNVSPSIIAEIGPEPAQKPDESRKNRGFNPELLVIRAGMIGGAAPVHTTTIDASSEKPAEQQPKIADDGHQLSPESDSAPEAADQKKPTVAPE